MGRAAVSGRPAGAEGFPIEPRSPTTSRTVRVGVVRPVRPQPGGAPSISEELGLHELAVEDALHRHQRPKLDRYAEPRVPELLTRSELDAALRRAGHPRGVRVRHPQRAGDRTARRRFRHRRGGGALGRRAGPGRERRGFLLYGLLDYVVDTHFDAVQRWTIRSRRWRTCCSTTGRRRRAAAHVRAAQGLVTLRRVVLPMREVVNSLHAPGPECRRRRWRRTSRTSTTTCCGPPSGPSRCATWYNIFETHLTLRQPAQRHHEEGDELGGDHRGADRGHRLLRPERALPGLRAAHRASGRPLWSCSRCRACCTSRSSARTGCSLTPLLRGASPAPAVRKGAAVRGRPRAKRGKRLTNQISSMTLCCGERSPDITGPHRPPPAPAAPSGPRPQRRPARWAAATSERSRTTCCPTVRSCHVPSAPRTQGAPPNAHSPDRDHRSGAGPRPPVRHSAA